MQKVLNIIHWSVQGRRLAVGISTLFLIAVVGSLVYIRLTHNENNFTGNHECIAIVKQIEGSKFNDISELKCNLGPRTIGNSSLGAKYYSYSGQLKNPEGCADPIDPGMTPQLQLCPDGSGVILSNGKRYAGLGSRDNVDDRPFNYDECYAGTGIDMLPPPTPTSRDLYFYQGNLYDRDIYTNVPVKTPIGNCVVNGTTLTNNSLSGALQKVTNVAVSYSGFPRDCSGIPAGSSGDDFYKCVNLVTAARADLAVCHSGLDIVQTKEYKIKSYKQGPPGMVGSWCEEAYVQRMAALNKCEAIADATLRLKCRPLVLNPYVTTTRVFGAI